MRKTLTIVVGAGLGAAIVAAVYVLFFANVPEYALSISPIISEGQFGTYTHVVIKNTGRRPVTNLVVDYGNNTKPDVIPVLNPGDRILLSPPVGSNLSEVRVTTAEGIDIVKQYIRPPGGPLVGIRGF